MIAGRLDCPGDGKVFEVAPGDTISSVAKERFNQYGLAVGVEFVIAKTRAGRSIEIHCKHFGEDKANKHKSKDSLVRKDPVTGEVKSDRVRDRTDQRTGCQVRYSINYRRIPESESVDKQWFGRWMYDPVARGDGANTSAIIRALLYFVTRGMHGMLNAIKQPSNQAEEARTSHGLFNLLGTAVNRRAVCIRAHAAIQENALVFIA